MTMVLLLLLLLLSYLWTPGKADPDYIRAISVRYRRCPFSYPILSVVVRYYHHHHHHHHDIVVYHHYVSELQARTISAPSRCDTDDVLPVTLFYLPCFVVIIIIIITTMTLLLLLLSSWCLWTFRHGRYPRHLGAIQTMSFQLLCSICRGSLSSASSSPSPWRCYYCCYHHDVSELQARTISAPSRCDADDVLSVTM